MRAINNVMRRWYAGRTIGIIIVRQDVVNNRVNETFGFGQRIYKRQRLGGKSTDFSAKVSLIIKTIF